MQSNFKVSIVLPAYNGERFIESAILSILNQTYSNFELIIINDGSTDKTTEIINLFLFDQRIIFIDNVENLGLSASLNLGIKHASGKYIVRMDQDDISLYNRIEVQVNYLEKNSDYLGIGSWAKIIDENENIIGYHKHSVDHNTIGMDLRFKNPFVHSSMCIRASVFKNYNLRYSENVKYSPPEDFDLWSRMWYIGKLGNIPQVLILYRHHSEGMSKSKFLNRHSEIIIDNIINISESFLHKSNYEICRSDIELLINFLYKRKIDRYRILKCMLIFIRLTSIQHFIKNFKILVNSIRCQFISYPI